MLDDSVLKLIKENRIDDATKRYAEINDKKMGASDSGKMQRHMAEEIDKQYGTNLKKTLSSIQTKTAILSLVAIICAFFAIIVFFSLFESAKSGTFLVNAAVGGIVVIMILVYKSVKKMVYDNYKSLIAYETEKIQ